MDVLLLALLISVASAHLCILHPAQRGEIDISTPGSGACFKKVAPCGGLPAQNPNTTLIGGEANSVLIQQNLNHYAPGARGWISVGFSQLANPQSDSDFETIDHYVDYYAYHQWTQTNITLQIAIPNIECAHCVLQIKYQPRKPTEPVFLQCVDIAVRYQQSPASHPRVNHHPLHSSSSAALLPLIGLSEQGGGVVNVHSFDPTTGNITNIMQIDAYVGATGPQSPQAVGAYVSQDVIAVNRQDDILYLLKSNDYFGIPNLVLVIDLKNGTLTRQLPITGLMFAISGMSFDSSDGTLAVVGLKNSSADNWYYFAGKIDLTSGAFREIVASSADVSPYVDFSWSDYDPVSQSFYVFARHEDQPTTLQAQLFTLNLQSPKVTVVNVSLDFIFSSFFIDSRTPNALLAFSPGPVDPSNGDVISPKWQVIRIDPTNGSIGTVAAAPASANNLPIWWGGGLAGFSNGKSTTTPDSNNFHFLPVSAPFFPHPRQLIALNYNLQTNAVTQLPNPLPFFFNIAWV